MLERIDISLSQSLTSTRLTRTAGCRDPPTAQAQPVPGWSSSRETRDVMNPVCSLLCQGPCSSRAVKITPSMYRQLLMWDVILPVLLRHLCPFIILNVTNAVLWACLKQRLNATCRPMFKRAGNYTTRYQLGFSISCRYVLLSAVHVCDLYKTVKGVNWP